VSEAYEAYEAPPFAVDVRREGGVAAVSLVGELDMATAPELEEALTGLEAGYERLVVDLSRCSFFASSGISILLEHNARAARDGFELVIVKAPPIVQRIFDLTHLDGVLTFRDA